MAQHTKTALLDVAEAAVRARGFDAFSYADLAQAVGIRKASVHHHFPTKAALSEALMQRYHDRLQDLCGEITEENMTAVQRLAAFIDIYRAASNGGESLCLCAAFSGSRDSLSDDVKAQIAAFQQMIFSWLETVFAQAQHDGTVRGLAKPELEAPALLALVEGAQLAARAQADIAGFDAATALFHARLG